MNFVLRKLGPLACRDQELFMNSARGSLKIALPPAKRGKLFIYFEHAVWQYRDLPDGFEPAVFSLDVEDHEVCLGLYSLLSH